jgi:acetoin utilization protein AcuB
MLVENIILQQFPILTPNDTVGFALQLMDEYEVQHLPVATAGNYTGLVAKDNLLDEAEEAIIAATEIVNVQLQPTAFIANAIQLFTNNNISILPIVTEQQELKGCITITALVEQIGNFLGTHEPGGIIVVEVERRNYSFGEISRLVETNDAYITQLNTYTEASTGLVIVSIKINKLEISDIVATFQRYDYSVRYYFGDEQYANELKQNYNHLMAYLNV